MNNKRLILIVDDEPRNQRIISEILEEDRFELKYANDGEQALKILEVCVPDIILLDIMMPGIDGYAVCKTIRSASKFALTKIILISGKAMIEEKLKGYESGADEYLTKPFVPEELTAKINVFLRLNNMERELINLNSSLDKEVQERTERLLAAEAQMAHSAKLAALGEMAGGLAHEINTPLAVILLTIEQMDAQLVDESHISLDILKKSFKRMETVSLRVASIIKALRTFSRDGEKDPIEHVLLKTIVDDTLILCSERFNNGNVNLTVEMNESIEMDVSPTQISQVFLNFLNNSYDAIKDRQEKWIRFKAKEVGENVQISITDSGEGISEEFRKKLFQPFFTTKDPGRGTGLGLSISRRIIERHGGSISLNENSKNTEFVITIPKASKDLKDSNDKVA